MPVIILGENYLLYFFILHIFSVLIHEYRNSNLSYLKKILNFNVQMIRKFMSYVRDVKLKFIIFYLETVKRSCFNLNNPERLIELHGRYV